MKAQILKRPNQTVGAASYTCPWCMHVVSSPVGNGYVLSGDASWFMAQCTNSHCSKCVLIRLAGNWHAFQGMLDVDVFPPPQETYSGLGVPPLVASDFTEALRCKAHASTWPPPSSAAGRSNARCGSGWPS